MVARGTGIVVSLIPTIRIEVHSDAHVPMVLGLENKGILTLENDRQPALQIDRIEGKGANFVIRTVVLVTCDHSRSVLARAMVPMSACCVDGERAARVGKISAGRAVPENGKGSFRLSVGRAPRVTTLEVGRSDDDRTVGLKGDPSARSVPVGSGQYAGRIERTVVRDGSADQSDRTTRACSAPAVIVVCIPSVYGNLRSRSDDQIARAVSDQFDRSSARASAMEVAAAAARSADQMSDPRVSVGSALGRMVSVTIPSVVSITGSSAVVVARTFVLSASGATTIHVLVRSRPTADTGQATDTVVGSRFGRGVSVCIKQGAQGEVPVVTCAQGKRIRPFQAYDHARSDVDRISGEYANLVGVGCGVSLPIRMIERLIQDFSGHERTVAMRDGRRVRIDRERARGESEAGHLWPEDSHRTGRSVSSASALSACR